MKLSWICMATLHVQADRLAIVTREAALESVYDSAAAEQVLDGSDIGAAQRLRFVRAVKVGPVGRYQRLASVGKNQNQM
jgi:hypothetical protein